jgi:opacity protein-like surface antigen
MIRNIQYQNNQISRNFTGLILFLISTSVFAANGHIFLGGTIGASEAIIGNNNPTIRYYDGNLTDAYPLHAKHTNTATIGVNSGYAFEGDGLIPAIALSLGFYGTPGDYDYQGQLIETAIGDPSSTLYNYQYHVNSTRLIFEAQFAWTLLEKFAPFINMGIGPAWNRLGDYKENPVDSTGYVALPPFQSHNNTNFAYQIGLGIGYSFNFDRHVADYQHERISLGYRYVNLGNTSFGTRGTVYPYSLDIGRLISNEAYLTYTHLF